MTPAPRAPEPSRSLGVSIAAHAALLGLLVLLPHLRFSTPPPFEVEITSPFLGTGPAKLGAPKPLVRGKILPKTEETPKVPPKPAVKTPPPPKEWTLPSKTAKPVPPPPPAPTPGGVQGGQGTAVQPGGMGAGADRGSPHGLGDGGTPLSAFPRLINGDEVAAELRRVYPESERRAGREGDVVIVLHIDAVGDVGRVDVAGSAGAAFDAAARKVGAMMRFSPALGLDGKPTAVALPQKIQFRLTDQ
ncbi:MAG: TonB family protein [Elusimicrobia bacterium]|nr:TonB family protein [Elusimicrobiota bacterium]